MKTLVLLALVGLGAQLVDGSLGMAYGVTSTTLLLAIGTNPAAASATVHLAEIGTTLASGFSHWRFGNVDWKVVAKIGVPGAIGSFAGATFLAGLSTEVAAPWTETPAINPGPFQFHSDESCVRRWMAERGFLFCRKGRVREIMRPIPVPSADGASVRWGLCDGIHRDALRADVSSFLIARRRSPHGLQLRLEQAQTDGVHPGIALGGLNRECVYHPYFSEEAFDESLDFGQAKYTDY